ncbi:MAG: glycoside hydrolase family 130 protein [Aggregatilineales bacterium]
MGLTRNAHNPLIRPRDVRPSYADFEVIGTFNAGVALFQDEIILLLRVAERPVQREAGQIFYPHMAEDSQISVQSVAQDDPHYDTHDARMIRNRHTDDVVLSSISHLRLARSNDGIHFTIADTPWLRAEPPYETFGVEDARITRIGDTYYVNYSAVSRYGIATALVSTTDFQQIERHGIMLPPANRDVVLFPERIGERYVCYHRPMPGTLGGLNIWQANSPDLQHWGGHRIVLEAQPEGWEAGRVGGGAPPIRTDHGWLSIYHAADRQDRYCLGAFLTPLDEPGRVIARSREPILSPEADYETHGFFPGVVFGCGALVVDGQVRVYYGAADESIALAEAPLDAVLAALRPEG